MNNPFRKQSIVQAYAEAQKQMRYWREEEMRLRKEVANLLSPDHSVTKSSHNCDGLVIKVERHLVYSIDKDADFSDLTPQEQECFSWIPRLLVRPYKELTDRSAMDNIVTVREAPPTIKILEK